MDTTYSDAISHPIFIEVFDKLLINLFLLNRQQEEAPEISINNIKKATWLASIAALGEGDKEKNLACSFGALLHLFDTGNEVYTKACYILQSRTGNIISSSHLPKIFKNKKYDEDFGSLLNIELAGNRAALEYKFSDDTEVYFTKFQAKLWDSLVNGNNIAISAPTSAGKSFVIKKYISELITNKQKDIIYVVPTKALINQVSNELHYLLKSKANVYTTYRETVKDKSSIFVLTPERTLKLFQDKNFKDPALVFIDEVHNIEDTSRGAVFENSIYKMVNKWSESQFVVAGPYIDKLSQSISDIANIELVNHQTFSSPVFQLKVSLTLQPNCKTANYKIASPTGNILKGELDLKRSLYSKVKSNKGDAIAAIMELFDPSDLNIIYAPRRKDAETWAQKIAPVVGSANPDIVNGADQKIKDLIEFLAEEVHPKYSLIRTLRLGVAYHHAGLPDIARLEIEELYSESLIKNIVCTSTLVQGVNLPADRLIIINPKVDKEEMSDFEFFNLIGRAGRVNTKLYGEVYCIDILDEQWGESRLTTDKTKSVSSATITSINNNRDNLPNVISLSREEIEEFDKNGLYSLVSYLRSLYKVDENHFKKMINSSELSRESKEDISSQLEELSLNLKIPDEIIAKNPFIDPVLQNIFYEDILRNGVESWLITRKPIDTSGLRSKAAHFSEQSYYYQFWSVLARLNEIFNFESEINNSYDDYIGIGLLVKDCHSWMLGKSHRFFIENKLSEVHPEESKVDKAARYVTKHISKNITFITVKYLMLWSEVVSSFLTEEQKELNSYILNLPSMLEMGSYDPAVLELMSVGINRSIALRIKPLIRKNEGNSIEEVLGTLDRKNMSPLFNRYLQRAGF